ncbi:MAG: hypothetical protein QM638_00735 [Nocardioides sp.]|uniref:hypothetical protein n=1 Tax=Nocardioides sp. TaxID=35761 RepID=UPI0039E522AB
MTLNASPRTRLALTLASAAVVLGLPVIGTGAADAAAPLTCHASMSNAHPKKYSSTFVRVRTASHAKVRTLAHYKTTTTPHRAKANAKGRATVKYYISGATAGYRVRVDVRVRKNGHVRTCSTSFVPHS